MDQRRRASACTVHISIECSLPVCAMDSRSFRDPSQSVIQILNHQAVAVCDFRRFILSVVFVSCLINGSSSNALFKAGKVIVLIIVFRMGRFARSYSHRTVVPGTLSSTWATFPLLLYV